MRVAHISFTRTVAFGPRACTATRSEIFHGTLLLIGVALTIGLGGLYYRKQDLSWPAVSYDALCFGDTFWAVSRISVLEPQQGQSDQRKEEVSVEDDAGISRRKVVVRSI